ncbi:MAG TPA: XrtA/PEP-CTERM system-associated ATPase [Acetobacteraceae bacterium]|nr:XrtA/PEP-CTERM system-associated ATPase [Acetobacteraceae bacterium]
MYHQFYKLSGPPFNLTPDNRFFFGSTGHTRAISHLMYGLAQEEGFVVITGEVGAGKTTLVERLTAQLGSGAFVIARIVTTLVSGEELLRLVVGSFGVRDTAGDKATLLRRFEQTVAEHHRFGRRCLLIVDEAQNLPLAALEELRMLSNITVGGRASVQMILLGQPQFRDMLASRDLDQLRQRVLASYHLGPLDAAETRSYIEHRLRTVGWVGDPSWDDDAFAAIFAHTQGIPRRINTLCSRVLLYGALEEAHRLTAPIVNDVAAELARDLGANGAAPQSEPIPAAAAALSEDATARLAALEDQLARQRRTLDRLLGLLSAYAESAA